jgi:sarcosine oxidase, subunit alpha
MSEAFRTSTGGRIDRARTISFSFDGQRYMGHAGDTLASALLANGVHLVGRSFKYHRPRGIVSAGAEEPNALIGVDRGPGRYAPNLRATQIELFDGLVAESQNRWPSLRRDVAAIGDLLSPLIPAGFYYKTFMQPAGWWARIYEPRIREAAGLGRPPEGTDPDRYTQRHVHCETLVVGAGPAGIAAALAAAASGERVMLCDEQAELGGSLLSETRATIDGKSAGAWLAAALARLRAMPNVTLLPRTTAFGYFAENFVALAERVTDHLAAPDADLPRERLWQVSARDVVLATGAIERPLVFPENDRPGVMLADAARTYATRYGVLPGKRAVIFTAHDDAYGAALDLAAAGVAIACIADLRPVVDGMLPQQARAAGMNIVTSATVTGTRGRLRVHEAHVGRIAANGDVTGVDTVSCDLLLMSGGWTPSVHLHSQARGKLVFAPQFQAFVPGETPQRCRSVGSCAGIFGLQQALGAAARVENDPPRGGGFAGAVPHDRSPKRARAFVDYQNDVTAKDLTLALREGFRSIEHVKRYTTNGMATDQGKTSNINALAIVAAASGREIPQVGLTTFRQPYTPVTFGTLAGASRGALFDPVRTTPIHAWAEAEGAVFEDVGQWKRARYFPRAGEDMHAAVARECKAVRARAGVFDASTLGKIEVVGPDAAEFLERMYINAWAKLEPGRCRYGILLNEAGFVIDDGVVGRMARDRFHVTTTTGGAARVLSLMEDYLQTEWPELRVWLTSTTEQWAVIAVQGPRVTRHPGAAGGGHRSRARGLRAYERARGTHRWRADAAVPRQLHRRARLRGERSREPGPRGVGGDLGRGAQGGRRRLRHRGDARVARREGLRDRRPGNRRHGDAGRSRTHLGDRQEQEGFCRQALALAAGHGGQGPQATGRAAHAGSGDRARRRRADHRRSDADARHAGARPRDIVLSQRGARPLDRAGAGRRRPRAVGRDAARADARGPHRGHADFARVPRSQGEPARWLIRSTASPRSPSPIAWALRPARPRHG